ncbi:MAG TPA: cupin domain-containing protein [Acetobacteraceae bacterium]|nr:cupin domain-containing protein [Acetobacteraceae bacterium]
MTGCRFLDELSFASLIAPVSEEEFRARYWEQQPLVVQRNDPGYYGDFFTVEDFDAAVMRLPRQVKINNATRKGAGGTTSREASTKGREDILAELRAGGSLILEQLQRYDPKLGLFSRVLWQEVGHAFETNLYLTPPYGKSSVPHWDNTDVFILQVFGSKLWRIEKERRVFPVRPDKMGDEPREFRGEVTELTLAQGDLLYIPRGFMHIAECGPDASLHISVGVVPVVLEELLHAIITAAVRGDERLRVALPPGFMHEEPSGVVKRASAALRALADPSFVGAVFDQFRDELVQAAALDISGQIADAFRERPITAADIVGPRRGVICRLHPGEESVRLNVGTRAIVFPGIFGPALDFALNTQEYAVASVPGAFDDATRIAFVERLIEEGLVVRKGAVS